jgi:hypothetical protein
MDKLENELTERLREDLRLSSDCVVQLYIELIKSNVKISDNTYSLLNGILDKDYIEGLESLFKKK